MSREYPARPIVGIGAVVLKPDAVLLVRRGREPALGSWSLPGGAQRIGETAEAAARRELHEETGLTVGGLVLAGAVDSIHLDPDGRARFHYTILDFAGLWLQGDPAPGDDVTNARFVAYGDLAALGLWSETLRIIDAACRLLL